MAPHQRARNAIQCNSRAPLPNTYRFAIRFAYDGIGYHGYQSQGNEDKCPTVQDAIETRLRQLLKRKVRVLGWGRTDVGVHANGAVCTVDLGLQEIKRLSSNRRNKKKSSGGGLDVAETTTIHDENNNEEKEEVSWEAELSRAAKMIQSTLKEFKCSSNLPGSITTRRCTPVPPTFDARFSCLWKRYVYTISCSKMRSPILSRYSWQMDCNLDYCSMVQAANLFSGRHDFSWLSVIEPGDQMNPIRDLSLTIEKMETVVATGLFFGHGGSSADSEDTPVIYKISAKCDFFLYKMVRRIVGALVVIGSGKVPLVELESCIRAHDDAFKHDGGTGTEEQMIDIPEGLLQSAPAYGLSLDHVEYGISI
jgi:Pseudouridylate synthase